MFSGNQEEFAQTIDQSPSAISHYLGKRNITDAFCLKVSRNVPVSKRWLMTGEGEMFSTDPSHLGGKPTERHEGQMLKSYILSNGISARALGLMMGLAESSASKTVIQYFGSKQLSLQVKEKALDVLQAREDEVFPIHQVKSNNENTMYATLAKNTNGKSRPIYPIATDDDFLEIPFVPQRARAGLDVDRYWEEPVETVRIRRSLLPTDKKQWWVIEVNGDSMGEKLSSGTRVLAYWVPRPDWRLAPSRVWAIQYSDEFVIKRVRHNQLEEQKGIMLHSDNPPPDPFFVKVDDIRHIWIIRKVIESEVY